MVKNRLKTAGTDQSAVKSADRVLDILELIAQYSHSRRELSHSEIAAFLDIPKSSLTPLLRNLVERGFVEMSPSGRGHRLGKALLALTQPRPDLATRALPFMAALSEATGESCALNEYRGDETEVVASLTGPSRLVAQMRTGDRAPLYATSGGKAILARLPDAQRKTYLETADFRPITPKTILNSKDLAIQLDDIARTGFAYSTEEFTPGIVGVAMALTGEDGLPIASLNVVMPAVRFTEDKRRVAEDALSKAVHALQRSL